MEKSIVVRNKDELNKFRKYIMYNLDQGVSMLQELMDSKDSLSFFKSIKFEKTVIDALTGEPENLLEAINQCQTYLVSIMGVEYLFEKYPDKIFAINFGNVSGYDIESDDGSIIAECFAATSYKNNDKLKSDLERLSENCTAIHKYEFFNDFKSTDKVIKNFEKKYPDITIIKFEDTK